MLATAPLLAQLSPRIVALPHLGTGVHRLTLEVSPEAIGSVRVVAEIRPDAVRIELTGGTELAREALRGVLADLRRDLAATGSTATLDLGSGSASSSTGSSGSGSASAGAAGSGGSARGDRSPSGQRGPGTGGDDVRPVDDTASALKSWRRGVDVLA